MSDISEFERGIRHRQAAVVIAAIQCVRFARRNMLGTHGFPADDEKLYETMSQIRFNPVYQKDLIAAVRDLVDFETGSGKYSPRLRQLPARG